MCHCAIHVFSAQAQISPISNSAHTSSNMGLDLNSFSNSTTFSAFNVLGKIQEKNALRSTNLHNTQNRTTMTPYQVVLSLIKPTSSSLCVVCWLFLINGCISFLLFMPLFKHWGRNGPSSLYQDLSPLML